MSGLRRRVLFVKEGRWGDGSEANNAIWLENMLDLMERVNTGEDRLEIEIADTAEEARERLKRAPSADLIVFLSRSMIGSARALKKEHPYREVIVFTGLIPDDEVAIVNKAWLVNRETFHAVLKR